MIVIAVEMTDFNFRIYLVKHRKAGMVILPSFLVMQVATVGVGAVFSRSAVVLLTLSSQ